LELKNVYDVTKLKTEIHPTLSLSEIEEQQYLNPSKVVKKFAHRKSKGVTDLQLLEEERPRKAVQKKRKTATSKTKKVTGKGVRTKSMVLRRKT
ncbi:unnamed protein product, partial [marine sediment metagenome]